MREAPSRHAKKSDTQKPCDTLGIVTGFNHKISKDLLVQVLGLLTPDEIFATIVRLPHRDAVRGSRH